MRMALPASTSPPSTAKTTEVWQLRYMPPSNVARGPLVQNVEWLEMLGIARDHGQAVGICRRSNQDIRETGTFSHPGGAIGYLPGDQTYIYINGQNAIPERIQGGLNHTDNAAPSRPSAPCCRSHSSASAR